MKPLFRQVIVLEGFNWFWGGNSPPVDIYNFSQGATHVQTLFWKSLAHFRKKGLNVTVEFLITFCQQSLLTLSYLFHL